MKITVPSLENIRNGIACSRMEITSLDLLDTDEYVLQAVYNILGVAITTLDDLIKDKKQAAKPREYLVTTSETVIMEGTYSVKAQNKEEAGKLFSQGF